MSSAERNDIDITKLFAWGKKVTIDNKGESLDVYIRLVGDADFNRARVYAIRKSAELRRKLKTPDSDERLAFLPDATILGKEELVESMIVFLVRESTIKALNNVKIPEPKELSSDATLEEQEAFQQQIDDYPHIVDKAINDYVKNEIDEQRKQLLERSLEDLLKEYEAIVINSYCENEMITRFKDMCVYFGAYTDSGYKNRLFKSIDEFNDLPTKVKQQFIDEYVKLDVGSDNLKN